MCGFAGCHTPHDSSLMDLALLARMTGALAHRGPDDMTMHRQPGLALGINRLAIVDLAGGRQPIHNETGDVVLVCNGEIFNHRQLRDELKARGHRFRAEVDVEVLVHLYEEFGLGMLDRINGQFAFALYDARQRMLLLARDPAGIAPLFYVWRDNTLLFGSEIKSLLEHPLVERRTDLTGLDQVLTLPGVVSPRTLFAGVHSVSPGQLVMVEKGRLTSRNYWDLDYPEEKDIDPGSAADFDALDARLRHAVGERLMADVPVGLYLSGGLDSSLVAAIAGDLDRTSGSLRNRHAYSIGFSDQAIDERRQQTLVAEHIGLRHHTSLFTTGDLESRLRQAVRHAESPLKESYDTCSLVLSGSVRANGEKVVLTGEGADELFGGYVGYQLDGERQFGGNGDEFGLDQQVEYELRDRLWGDSSFFYEKNYTAFDEVKTALYAPELAGRLGEFACTGEALVDAAKLRGRHPLHKRSYVDFKLRLGDHLLADHGDRVSYANSVEARYPFLDLSVIDWVRNTSPHWLFHRNMEKYPLREVAARYLPESIARRPKFGFVAPSSAALLQQRVEWVEDYLSYDRIRNAGYFNADTVERLKAAYRQPGFVLNTTFDTDLLMIVLSFELFRDCFAMPRL